MPRLHRAATYLGAALVAASLAGCPKLQGIEWAGHVAFAPTQSALALQQDAGQPAPFTEQDYINLGLSRVALSGLPGLAAGDAVAVALRVTGALPEGKAINTIVGLITLDAQGTGELRHEVKIGPFPFRGDVALELVVQRIAPEESLNIHGRIAGASGLLRRLHPYAEANLRTAKSLSTGIIGAFRAASPTAWKTRFHLRAAKPEVPTDAQLLRGETVVIWQPHQRAPAALRARLAPEALTRELVTGMDALNWKESGEPFREAPFVVVMVQRVPRLGWLGQPAYKDLETVRGLIRARKYDEAQKLLAAIADELGRTSLLTVAERSLILAFCDLQQAHLALRQSETTKVPEGARKEQLAALAIVRRILTAHASIVLPDEQNNLRAEEKELARAVEAK